MSKIHLPAWKMLISPWRNGLGLFLSEGKGRDWSTARSQWSMFLCSHPLLIQPPNIPLRLVEKMSSCRTELCQQKAPGRGKIEADFAAEPREVVATIPGGIAEVCGRGAEGPWQGWFKVGLDLKGFFQSKQFCGSADKHWLAWFGKLSFGDFSSGHQTQLFLL